MSRFQSTRRASRGALAAVLFTAATFATAQPAPADDEAVLVTASRAPEKLDDTLWSSTILTRADIEARQPASVQELLADFAGVNIVNNGGLGKVSSVFIRGAESDHTLLLIDGVRVASATAGTAPFELIPVNQIERIELVRGPRSTLYGADAIGGVIQIFTRGASKPGLSIGGTVSGGSHDTRMLGADVRAQGERAWFSVGMESFDTNGFNSCASAAATEFAACFTDEPDLDGYRNNAGSLGAGYAFNDDWNVELRSLLTDGRTEFDGSFANSVKFTERVVSLGLDGTLSDDWKLRVTLGRNEDKQDNFIDGVPAGTYETTRNSAGVQLDGRITNTLRIITGVDLQRDNVEDMVDSATGTGYSEDSRDVKGAFGELHGEFGAWSTLAGVRFEDNEQFGSHVTGNAGAAYQLTERHRLSATWGTAFHAPSFNDLYYQSFGMSFGNPDLEPEESRSVEFGIDGVQQLPLGGGGVAVNWSLHAFQTDVDDLIGYDPVTFAPVNIDSTRIRGAELQARWRGERWQIGGQFTLMDPVNRSGTDPLAQPGEAPRTLLLPRRSKESASLDLRRSWSSFSIGTVARYQGERFDDLGNTRRLGGYVTIDLAATQAIGRAFELQARVANLFDRDYTTAAFYLQDGINYQVTLRYRFAPDR